LLLAAGVGAGVALGMAFPEHVLPLVGLGEPPAVKSAPAAARPDETWAPSPDALEANSNAAPKFKILATTGLVIAARAPDCAHVLQSATAPNGEPWPERSGYVAGYPQANTGKQMQVFIDNSANTAPVFVKLYDLDRNANVRHVYIRAGETWNVGELAAGKYEVRYQDVVADASATGCGPAAAPQIVRSGT
jgi:hypothetical protein